MRRERPFIVIVMDAEKNTYQYTFQATSRRQVKGDARRWCEQTHWGARVVAIHPAVGHKRHRLFRVAAISLAVAGTAIPVAMIVGLRLEGAF